MFFLFSHRHFYNYDRDTQAHTKSELNMAHYHEGNDKKMETVLMCYLYVDVTSVAKQDTHDARVLFTHGHVQTRPSGLVDCVHPGC